MRLSINKQKAKLVASAGLFLSVGLVLHYAESLLPVFQLLPGARLGLANIATLLAFSWFGSGFALTVGLLRCFLTGIFAGAVTTTLYGGVGTLASVLAMTLAHKWFPHRISTVGRSMLGAFFFNLGQVAVCALILESGYVFAYLPPLAILSAVCGLLTGMLASRGEKLIPHSVDF